MNGVHDLGGMQDFGPVVREANEPVFHEPWEAVVVAMSRASRRVGLTNIDESRHGIERLDPVRYLESSYYERWLEREIMLLLEKGIITQDELDSRANFFSGNPDAPATAAIKGPLPESQRGGEEPGDPYKREATAPPRFAAGDAVLTRRMNPRGHTRLPRYARGRRGVIDRLHGVYVFPDTNAHGLGEQPQPLYSVRFEAAELWGETAEAAETIYLDLWESYLLPA
jgi:nitrile hydratase beta subunit